MRIAAREFTSGAECIAHAAAVRARLFSPNIKAAAKPRAVSTPVASVVKPKIEPIPFVQRPLWKCQDMHFDAHVIESRRILEMLKAGEIELVKVGRRTISQIVTEVLKDYPKVTVAQVRGGGRGREVVKPRQMSMWVVRNERPDLSLPAIGRWFGGRDHTTVLASIRKVDLEMSQA